MTTVSESAEIMSVPIYQNRLAVKEVKRGSLAVKSPA